MQNNATVRRQGVLTSVFLSLLFLGLPLLYTDGYFNITQTKAFFFYISATAFCAVFFCLLPGGKTAKSYLQEKYAPPYAAMDVCMVAFLFFVLTAAVLSEYKQDVWIGAAARYQGALTVLLYVLVYFIVSRNLHNPTAFLSCAVLAFCFVCIAGVCNCFDIDLLGLHDRLAAHQKGAYISTIGNINFYSSYLCLLLPLVITGFYRVTKPVSRVLCTVALLVGGFGMMVTASESFALGLTVSLAIIPLFLAEKPEQLKRFLLGIVLLTGSSQLYILLYKNTQLHHVPISEALTLFTHPVAAAAVICVCIAMYILLSLRPQVAKKGRSFYLGALCLTALTVAVCFAVSNTHGLGAADAYFKITDEWGSRRGEIWKQCLLLFKDFSFKEKLFGIGPESLQRISDGSAIFAGKVLDQAHNEYLQYLLTTGIAGLLSYLGILISTTVTLVRRLHNNTLAVGIFAGLVSYWLQATVNIAQPFTTPLMFAFVAILGGIAFNTERQVPTSQELLPKKRQHRETVKIGK